MTSRTDPSYEMHDPPDQVRAQVPHLSDEADFAAATIGSYLDYLEKQPGQRKQPSHRWLAGVVQEAINATLRELQQDRQRQIST